MDKSPDAFRTISEAAEELNVPQHVLRFWETRFAQIKPMKRAGGRRYYRPADVELLKGIRSLLYGEGYTIRGVQRILKEEGPNFVCGVGRGEIAARKSELPGDKDGDSAAPPAPGKAPLARPPEKGASGLSDAQQQSLNQALKELSEAKGLLESGS
jgi:DNA-binding transcriptional MerR regulator